MTLTAYTLEGPAEFELQELIWVTIQDTKDTLKEDPTESLGYKFMKWCWDQAIYSPIRAGATGGGFHYYGYPIEHAEKIRAWLLENGGVERT